MQISKWFLVVCASAAFCAFPLPSRGADTEAQIKAREALDKKLQELQTQPPTPAPSANVPAPRTEPVTPATPAPAPAPQEQPVASPAVEAPPIARPAPPVKAPPPAAVAKPAPARTPKAQPA